MTDKANEFVQGKTEILKTFTTKGYKHWVAREGVGAQTTLYKNGKRIGWCTDEGIGGECEFRGYTIKADKMVREFVEGLPKYKLSDYWKEQYGEQYGEEWDEPKWEYEWKYWYVSDFADIMLTKAEDGEVK